MENESLKTTKNEGKSFFKKKVNMKFVRKFFDMSKHNKYTIDDQTWDDLDMDSVFVKIDKTRSSAGKSALYYMLRNVLVDEKKLKERDKLIELFQNNRGLKNKLENLYLDLARDRKNSFLELLNSEVIINKAKYYLYTFLGKIVPAIIILCGIFLKEPKFILGLFGLTFINMLINNKEREIVKSQGLFYLRRIIKTAKKLNQINHSEFSIFKDKISQNIKGLKSIDLSLKSIAFVNMWGGLFEFCSVIFLLEESAYYSVSNKLVGKKNELMDLYYAVGEIEALIAIGSYKETLNGNYSKPIFKKEISLNIKDGVHPLIKKPVPNSLTMKKRGIVLTGTNMSGKSTFLRTVGINILLAQTFYFSISKSYEASLFNLVTSISPKDDVSEGKSYYMAEAESLLRIIKAMDDEVPVFCSIDEIFRGTNPVERIAASAEILKYINEGNTMSIVSTHDRELVNILKEDYEFYYFSEDVNKKKGLSFDYKLKKGVSKTKNAIKLLDFIGYPSNIISKSFERAKQIEENIN